MNAFQLRGKRGALVLACALALAACGHKSEPAKIVGFGPTPVDHGKSFNLQPDGNSAIWVRTEKDVGPSAVLVLDGQKLKTTVAGNLLTAPVPASLTATPGSKPLLVESGGTTEHAQSPAVSFMVN